MIDAPSKSLRLRNARIVTPTRVVESGTILITGATIELITSESFESSAADSTIDLEGLTLFPGFIDIHIHGAVGVDAMEASADDLVRVAQFLASKGVTAWLPTLVPSPQEQYERGSRSAHDPVRSKVHLLTKASAVAS